MTTRFFTERSNGRTYRWRGGKFIAVWESERENDHVPDDMIELPASLNRAHTTTDDLLHLVAEYEKQFAPQYDTKTITAKQLPHAVLYDGYTHVKLSGTDLRSIGRIEIARPEGGGYSKINVIAGGLNTSLLPDREIIVGKKPS